MSNFDLLSAVQPDGGWFAVVGIKDKSVVQKFAETREEVDDIAADFAEQRRNVFFGVAKYKTDDNRRKDNVQSLKAFWLDIDCGEAKARVDEKTGRPDGYIDQLAGLQALKGFCELVGLPEPIIVNSGRGLHVYWPLTEAVSREQWEPVAERLQQLCDTHKLYVDPAVFEVARILRIPGTLNFKDDPATEVTIIHAAGPVEFGAFKTLLGVKEKPPAPPKREISEFAKSLMDNTVSVFGKIMRRSAKGEGCQQLLDCYQNRETLSEVRWFDALSVAKFCVDKDTAIHKLSEGYPDYNPDRTEAKIRHILGPHTCREFAKNNAGGCDGCPSKDKITSPIVLGKEIAEAKEEVVVQADAVAYKIPKYPEPFFRGANGGVYRRPYKEEAEDIFVYRNDIYVSKRMWDPNQGDVVVVKLHLRKDGVRTFIIPNRNIADPTELKKTLAAHGVMCSKKRYDLMVELIQAFIDEFQDTRKAEHMRLQFGWADGDSKFIIGDREITKDGIFHSPPSSTTSNIAENMHAVGTLDMWKEIFALYGKPGMEPHALAALSAFGSPLLKFLGQNGVIFNLFSPRSGTGKTTVLHMINSVYGHPKRLCAVKADTLNAKILRLGIMNHLPFTIDEMTNTESKEFSELAYNMTQGRGKDRVKQSTNEMRNNLTSWACISVCSSNASFYEKLELLKTAPEGEMMRLIEYTLDSVPPEMALDTAFAKDMFDHKLMENYGRAGDIYAQYLVNNLEECKDCAVSIQAKIDRELKLTQRERIWSAAFGANIAGGLIARNLGLIDWDMKRIYATATTTLNGMRGEVVAPVIDVASVIADFSIRHVQNMLVVNASVDRRSNMAMLPTQEPRGELVVRFEPDTNKLFVVSKRFKDDCTKMQINYAETVKKLKDKGMLVHSGTQRITKGMKVVLPGVHCLVLDMTHPDFINMGKIVQVADDDGGGS